MSETYDAIVIGAGMVGSACALSLAESGLRILSIDSNPIGSGTTGRGMGHIAVTPHSPGLLALTKYSRRLWQRVLGELDADPEYLSCGTLWLARDEADLEALEARFVTLQHAEVMVERVSARALSTLEPNLCGRLRGALLVPADCVVTPARVAGALMHAAQKRGARTMIGFDVDRLEPGIVRLSDGTPLRTRATVLAGGYLSSRLIPALPIRPRKGHIVVAQSPQAYCFHQLIEIDYLRHAHASDADGVAFNVQPRPGGRVLIGSSRQYAFVGDAPEPDIVERMMARAELYMPNIRDLRIVETRAGFRPGCRDGLPIIGECPKLPGVYIATGHEGVGISASIGTGRLIADLIRRETPEIDPAPYRPGRFPEL